MRTMVAAARARGRALRMGSALPMGSALLIASRVIDCALLLGSALLISCGGASSVASQPPLASSPVPAPRPGILGCVESRELKDFVLELDARRREARRAALAELGASMEERQGAFGEAGAVALDQRYEAEGRRFAVAAELAPHFEPRVSVARQGQVLRRVDERPRAHPVDVLVCGVERCARPRSGSRVPTRPLLVELAPGESWGGPLELAYDYSWARVRYARREACAPASSSSAASATP